MRKNPMHDDPKVVDTEDEPKDVKRLVGSSIWYRPSDRERALSLALTLNAGVSTSAERLVTDAEVIRVYLSTEES